MLVLFIFPPGDIILAFLAIVTGVRPVQFPFKVFVPGDLPGVKDGKRSFDWPVIIRAVNTVDAMTATVEDVPFALLQHITARITAEVKGVNRVLYDLTPKPTGTIEWE